MLELDDARLMNGSVHYGQVFELNQTECSLKYEEGDSWQPRVPLPSYEWLNLIHLINFIVMV